MDGGVQSSENQSYVSPRFLLVGIIIMTTIILFLFYRAGNEVKIRDQYTPVKTMTPQKLADFGGTPADVTVGMFIRDIPQFDAIRGTFLVDATVWFLFDPRLISVERVGNFAFERAEILGKTEPYVRVSGNTLFVRYDMRLRFTMSFNYQDFPFDGHRLNFTLVHYFLSPAEVNFTSARSNFVVNADINIPGWRPIDRRVATGFAEEQLETRDNGRQETLYPKVVFSVDFERIGSRHIISIFIPLLLIFYIALFSFSLDPAGKFATQVISLSYTAITALIAYRFVIENMAPPVGYFMSSDYIFLMFLIACCVIFFANIFSGYLSVMVKYVIAIVLELVVVLTFALTV